MQKQWHQPLVSRESQLGLGETTIEFLERKKKKQGITCTKIPQGQVYRFIAEAIALKGTNTYISEGLFGQCLGKANMGHPLDMAKEIANAAVKQMQNVKLKAQKLVKCSQLWVGLFRQATGQCQIPTNPLLDASSPSKPSKQASKASQSKKRKLERALQEQALKEQASKKSPSISTSLSIDAIEDRDNLKFLLEKKKKERELKLQLSDLEKKGQADSQAKH